MTPPQGAGYKLRNRFPFFASRGGELNPNFVLKAENPDHFRSDLNPEIVFLSPIENGEALALWMEFHGGWAGFPGRKLGMAVHLELFHGPNFTPVIHANLEFSDFWGDLQDL